VIRSTAFGTENPCCELRPSCSKIESERLDSPGVTSGVLKEPVPDLLLNDVDGLLELLGDGLTLERLDGVRVRRGGHDDEGDDGRFGTHLLEKVIKT
jgi:hypothetical protein